MSNSLEKGVRKSTTNTFLAMQEKSSRVSSQREIELDAPTSIYLFVRGHKRCCYSLQHLCVQIKPSSLVAMNILATELSWEICEVACKVSLQYVFKD
jgi:hypothetical protein